MLNWIDATRSPPEVLLWTTHPHCPTWRPSLAPLPNWSSKPGRSSKTQPEKAAAVQLAGINKLLDQVAPGEHPETVAKRIAKERNLSGIRAGYVALLWYYEDSLDPDRFCIYDAEEREIHMRIAESLPHRF